MPINDQKIREFLLGSASELDEETLVLRLIADEGLNERLDHAENELMEDYLDGVLSDNEARLFRENFLISPERREIFDELKLLRAGVRFVPSIQPAADAVITKAVKPGFFSLFSRPLFAAAMLMLFLFAGFSVWYALFRDGRTPLEIEYASLNRRDLSDAAKTGPLYTISIIPATFRDDTSTARHPASKLTDTIVLRMGLLTAEPEGAEREVSIRRAGKRVFSVPGRVFRNAFGFELRAMVPKEILVPGNYEVEVDPADNQYAGTTYQLRID